MSIIPLFSCMVLQCVASQTVPSLPYSKPIAWIFVEVGNLRHIPMFPTCTRLLLISYCSTPAWFCTSCCHFDGSFRFVAVLLCLPSVCSVTSYIQYLIYSFLRRTPFTRIIFLNTAFSKALLNMALSKTLVYIHVLV